MEDCTDLERMSAAIWEAQRNAVYITCVATEHRTQLEFLRRHLAVSLHR